MIDALLVGLQTAFLPANLLACLIGVFLGTAIGVLPGIGPLAAISLLLPVTFSLDPTTAIVMLAGVYYGSEFGGATTSILLNLPGGASNAITCLDGYPMARNGRAGVALCMAAIASFVGGCIGIAMLMALTPLMVQFSQAFGPAEYFAMIVFCFVAVSTIGDASPAAGLAMVLLGVTLGTVGTDVYDGLDRFTFGSYNLIEGIGLAPLAMGLFGIAEIIASVRTGETRPAQQISLRSMFPSLEDWRRSFLPMLRGAAAGCVFGPLPGAGPSMAALVGYANEKKFSRTPEKFGKGAIEGVAAPESANNACVQTAFIPTLALGIPGTPTMAIMIGALMIHGVVPGPTLMSDHPDLFWGLVVSFWLGNILLLILNIPCIGLWVSMLNIPYRWLYPGIIVLICVGVFSVSGNVFDVWVALAFGVVGYLMRLWGFEPAPLLIGFILGPMLEENLRRAMIMGRGQYTYLVESPVSLTILLATSAVLIWSVLRGRSRAGDRLDAATE